VIMTVICCSQDANWTGRYHFKRLGFFLGSVRPYAFGIQPVTGIGQAAIGNKSLVYDSIDKRFGDLGCIK
jgi:hypothetical protein